MIAGTIVAVVICAGIAIRTVHIAATSVTIKMLRLDRLR